MNDADNVELAEAVAVEEAPVSERPEWLPEKFNTPEDMAASYSSLESKLGQGQDEIRAQIEHDLEISALKADLRLLVITNCQSRSTKLKLLIMKCLLGGLNILLRMAIRKKNLQMV